MSAIGCPLHPTFILFRVILEYKVLVLCFSLNLRLVHFFLLDLFLLLFFFWIYWGLRNAAERLFIVSFCFFLHFSHDDIPDHAFELSSHFPQILREDVLLLETKSEWTLLSPSFLIFFLSFDQATFILTPIHKSLFNLFINQTELVLLNKL